MAAPPSSVCKNIVNVRNGVALPLMHDGLRIISFIKRVECNNHLKRPSIRLEMP